MWPLVALVAAIILRKRKFLCRIGLLDACPSLAQIYRSAWGLLQCLGQDSYFRSTVGTVTVLVLHGGVATFPIQSPSNGVGNLQGQHLSRIRRIDILPADSRPNPRAGCGKHE